MIVWLALTSESEHFGITLQHYYPDIGKMRGRWDIDEKWVMTGQMPFGRIAGPAKDKTFRPDHELVRAFR